MRHSIRLLIGLVILLGISLFWASCSISDAARILKPAPTPADYKPPPNEVIQRLFERIDASPELAVNLNKCPVSITPSKSVDSEYVKGKCSDDPLACLETCTAKNHGPTCYALGTLIDNEKGPEARSYSGPLFYKACEFGIISGCTNRAAGMLEQEPDNEKAQKWAADTFERACELDDPWACTMHSLSLIEGRGGRGVDLNAAIVAARKACKFGDADKACQHGKKLITLIESRQSLDGQKSRGPSN